MIQMTVAAQSNMIDNLKHYKAILTKGNNDNKQQWPQRAT